jgi:hypothetical protein
VIDDGEALVPEPVQDQRSDKPPESEFSNFGLGAAGAVSLAPHDVRDTVTGK